VSRHRRRRAYRTRLARRRGPLARWWRHGGFSATDYIGTDHGTPGSASKGFWVLYGPRHMVVIDEATDLP
jgi:hypothetical protein